MNFIEKIIEKSAHRYAERQKFKQKIYEIKYGKNGKRRMPTGKKLTYFLVGNLTVVELYTLFIMYYLKDISALPVLITSVIGEIVALLVYQIKSLKENISNTGFVYELKMKEAEQCITDEAVG